MFELPGIAIPLNHIKRFGCRKAIGMSSLVVGLYDNQTLKEDLLRSVKKLLFRKPVNSNEIKDFILDNEGFQICEWCGIKCHVLHDHHFPIPKREGGKDTVRICGTCHANYHYVEQVGIPNRRFKALRAFVLKNSTKGYINE